jgi:cysteine desulfurase
MIKTPIYLDHNSTTPVDERVLEAMLPYFTHQFGNAASRTHAFGWTADEAVKRARRQVAGLINCLDQEIIFTSGSTEGINLAIKGVFENYQTKGKHFVTVATEHKAVLDTCKALEERGAEVTYLGVNTDGLINLDELRECITDRTVLVCVMYANNETGVIQPIKKITEIVHEKGSIMMCDATQAIGKVPVNVQEEGIDLLCLSAHKFYGPKGVGALYVRRRGPRVSLLAQIHGGGHERGIRSGTLNVPGIAGLGKACEIAQAETEENIDRIRALRDKLETGLLSLGDVIVNGSIEHRLPNTSNLSFKDVSSDTLLTKIKNIAVATGSACTSALIEPSHVLKAMGVPDKLAYSSIRFSLGKNTTEEEIDAAIAVVSSAINELRKK